MEHQALTIHNWSPRVQGCRFSGSGLHFGLRLTKLASANSAFRQSGKLLEVHFQKLQGGRCSVNRLRASKPVEVVNSDDGNSDSYDDDDDDCSAKKKSVNDPDAMNADERREWRRQIRDVLAKYPDNEEEIDPEEKKAKMQKLLADYPLVVNEEDPKWPEDADGWGFSLDQFFDKITIKNVKKDDDDDDDRQEIVWKDDDYIRPIKDIKTAEWEEILFKDISPLVILVHNRYKRPKENEKIREELEKAVHIIWNCRLPSPRCVAVDAVVETDLASALKVSKFPEVVFSKAGRVLYREREIRTADEFSKIMAYFYYGAAKPPCLDKIDDVQELIPTVQVNQ
ncbi:Thioredoxin-like fold domain-containing protein MRL7L, chloroplastic [Linum grandiflorum]